jgi:hypothetical protein
MLLSASRLHLGVTKKACGCHLPCTHVYQTLYAMEMSTGQIDHIQQALKDVPNDFHLPLKTLSVSSKWWNIIINSNDDRTIGPRLSRVNALHLSCVNTASKIPSICPNLTFLSLRLQTRHSRYSLDLHFPELTGLVIYVEHIRAFRAFKSWNLLKLQHLWITCGEEGPKYPLDPLSELFERERSSLLSFAISEPGCFSQFPPDIWSRAPNLLYLGLNSFKMAGIPTPPVTHPLRTLGFLQVQPHLFPRAVLGRFLSEWHNIKVIADVHIWEDIPPVRSKAPVGFHFHAERICHDCVKLANVICSQYGVRYEDRYGRSLEEFMDMERKDHTSDQSNTL